MSAEVKSLLSAPGEPPPVTFPTSVTLLDILKQLYVFNQELADNEPVIGLLYADTVQVMWPQRMTPNGKEVAYPGNFCSIRIKFEANSGPSGGGEITPFPFPPY